MSKQKKILLFIGLGIDVALTLFFFVISIIMIAKSKDFQSLTEVQRKYMEANPANLIEYLQTHNTVYLLGFVIPLFVLLALNVIGLLIYIKKTGTKKEKLQVSDLTEEQKEALKKELLKDLKDK